MDGEVWIDNAQKAEYLGVRVRAFRLAAFVISAAFGSLGGAILAWARALGEFGATIMFAGNVTGVTQTLPLAVYAEFQSSLDASIAAAAILVVAALAVLVGVHLVRADREQPL